MIKFCFIYPHLTVSLSKICLEPQFNYYSNRYGIDLNTTILFDKSIDTWDFSFIILGFGIKFGWESKDAAPF